MYVLTGGQSVGVFYEFWMSEERMKWSTSFFWTVNLKSGMTYQLLISSLKKSSEVKEITSWGHCQIIKKCPFSLLFISSPPPPTRNKTLELSDRSAASLAGVLLEI